MCSTIPLSGAQSLRKLKLGTCPGVHPGIEGPWCGSQEARRAAVPLDSAANRVLKDSKFPELQTCSPSRRGGRRLQARDSLPGLLPTPPNALEPVDSHSAKADTKVRRIKNGTPKRCRLSGVADLFRSKACCSFSGRSARSCASTTPFSASDEETETVCLPEQKTALPPDPTRRPLHRQ